VNMRRLVYPQLRADQQFGAAPASAATTHLKMQNESSLPLVSSGWPGSLRSRLRQCACRGGGPYGGLRSGSGLSEEPAFGV
jgi:hypothetical protein